MLVGREPPQCPHGENVCDSECWAPFLLADEWQSPARAEEGKLVKLDVQEDDTAWLLSGREGAVRWD